MDRADLTLAESSSLESVASTLIPSIIHDDKFNEHATEIQRLRGLYARSQAELTSERAAKRRAEDLVDKERALRRVLEDEVWIMRVQQRSI